MTHPAVLPWRTALMSGLVLFAMGLIGIASLAPTVAPIIDQQLANLPPDTPDIPIAPEALVVLSLLQPTLLLLIAVVVGLLTAPRVGLRSLVLTRIAGDAAGSLAWRAALMGALLAGGLIVGLDVLFQPFIAQHFAAATDGAAAGGRGLFPTLAGVLYGGITEELLVRWGFLSLVAWGIWRVQGRPVDRTGQAAAGVMWAAILASALVFAVGHLPALLAQVESVSALLLVRTLLLNSLGGLIFGWLYWQHNLETAMLAHGASHIVMTALINTLVLVG